MGSFCSHLVSLLVSILLKMSHHLMRREKWEPRLIMHSICMIWMCLHLLCLFTEVYLGSNSVWKQSFSSSDERIFCAVIRCTNRKNIIKIEGDAHFFLLNTSIFFTGLKIAECKWIDGRYLTLISSAIFGIILLHRTFSVALLENVQFPLAALKDT